MSGKSVAVMLIKMLPNDNDSSTLFNRTLGGIKRTWRDLTGTVRVKRSAMESASLPTDDLARLRSRIDDCLHGAGGEVSERARAVELGQVYLELNRQGRERFFRLLASEYDIDRAALARTVAAWSDLYQRIENRPENIDGLYRATESRLREGLASPRIRLLSRFNELPEGVKFLVDMRAELIPLSRKDPLLRGLDNDLKRLLTGWFDVGFLDLRCITWDAPASLLEKLVDYEAVHAITSWSDLRNRLAPEDRRCYAYFHPQMPNEPLIFVWVALVQGMSRNVQSLLDTERTVIEYPADEADTAIFYSISNAQSGLAGISFGNFLIKRVVKDLSNDYRNLGAFATLSPIPGFRGWLGERVAEEGDALLDKTEWEAVSSAARTMDVSETGAQALIALCSLPEWRRQSEVADAIRDPLMRLCARYLTSARRGKYARNRVAHFHLSNGARMERINWLGDTSEKGLDESAGMMINYLYEATEIERNHEAYVGEGKIAVASGFHDLSKG
uniref:Malonyl-CoA decarboxylase n=1 Tax=Candidatus Kentrum sp. MB TaxID=2138164 RepID=A0A450XE50_9GAMM|nr:MAG: malonyl-CoA decarboxylase [Candidatus Kentron sp. MB]VFK32087.1 MAG: malonyl-CoA decarboxylase [Candidatus Kentron sp. MB]VFK75647.1 MAG: malonyl-CoA decarboxylase [Candidatus Kentron sp. MB]